MRRWTALALLCTGLAAGCATGPQTPQQACQAAANDDPKVKSIIIRGVGNPAAQAADQDLLAAAKQDATLACLRARGVIRRGGVERQNPL